MVFTFNQVVNKIRVYRVVKGRRRTREVEVVTRGGRFAEILYAYKSLVPKGYLYQETLY